MNKKFLIARTAFAAISLGACAGTADNTITVEDWPSTSESTYKINTTDKAEVRAKRAERLYNKSLRK